MSSENFVEESEKEKQFNQKYDLGKQLGMGATAVVHSCTERGLNNHWAAKIITKKADQKTYITTECGILLKLSHPNIIRLKEVFEDNAKIYMILELATGGELFDRITTRGYYCEKDAALCVRQILEAVKYLHDNNVVHRDLKPENLLYENTSEDSQLKIADFGLAQVHQSNVKMNMVCGTPGYCAPEVLKGQPYDKSVDMWAVGVITYILLSGYEPFYEENEKLMYKRIMKADYDFNDPVWSNVSENAKDLVSKLLELKPGKRLTAQQALNHQWVNGKAAKANHMDKTHDNLKEFNARRKLKAFTTAVIAANIVQASIFPSRPSQQEQQQEQEDQSTNSFTQAIQQLRAH